MKTNDYNHYGTPVKPRDYGIVLRAGNNGRLFVSPSRLALAALAIESENKFEERVLECSGSAQKSHSSFSKRLRSRGGSALLRRDSLIERAEKYGNTTVALVRGNSKYRVSMSSDGESYRRVSCVCPDSQWSDVKGVEYELCKHASIVHLAIERDIVERRSLENSLTGLWPRERNVGRLPFDANDWNLTNVLSSYARGDSLYDISRSLSENSTDLLDNLVQTGNAKYAVLRQNRQSLGSSRLDGSLRSLEKTVRDRLQKAKFSFEGYALEFKDSKYETVGIRFRKGDHRVSLCFSEDRPPVLVEKSLLDYMPIQNMPVSLSTSWHESLDDATRKLALTRVIVPGHGAGLDIPVSKELRDYTRTILDS